MAAWSCVNPTYYSLLRSTDGGQNFQTVIANSSYGATPDLWIDRVQAGPLYLLTDTGLKVSSDHGSTFTQVSGALPGTYGDLRRRAPRPPCRAKRAVRRAASIRRSVGGAAA